VVDKVWFTGMFKHGQSDFFIQYIDPESHALRSYYPDFLVQDYGGSYEIVEIKGDNKIDDPVVTAKKEAAEQIAAANKMKYVMLRSSDLTKITDKVLDDRPILDFVEKYTSRMFKDLLPVYSLQAACGKFGAGEDVDCEGWVEVLGRKLDDKLFIVQAIGKSMEPEIPENSYCIFRHIPAGSRQNKIVLVQHLGIGDPETGGEYTIKKYSSEKIVQPDETWHHRRITLSPLNPDYEPIVIEGDRLEEGESFRVIGEFVDVV
jgi:SOS-response transcriptional repressor LexA